VDGCLLAVSLSVLHSSPRGLARSRASYQRHFAERDPWVSPAALARLKWSLHEAGRSAEFYE
jgi:hypothetical protein